MQTAMDGFKFVTLMDGAKGGLGHGPFLCFLAFTAYTTSMLKNALSL
ncbi:hypothetical protein RI845_04755 [Thalassotalea nanhaiensis]|uniref:Uncharacterized protein n=1 Tax=Thalassotalea nanhaiensis TaxID=3065648 RepID=A0ABY9TKV6_9GAMM|nr:hypothetical protein RI845_04755 [Colwelliaceae bacterium SQ345]